MARQTTKLFCKKNKIKQKEIRPHQLKLCWISKQLKKGRKKKKGIVVEYYKKYVK